MFDCRTNRISIERLGSIGFDWFLVRFRSISYAGKNITGDLFSKRRLKMEISFRFISSLFLIPLAQSQQISSFDVVETDTFHCEFSYRIRKYACLSISYSFNLSRNMQLRILFFEVTIKFRSCRKNISYNFFPR